MSGLPPIATDLRTSIEVRFVPLPDSCAAAIASLFDDLICAGEQHVRHVDPKRLSRLEGDNQLKFRRLIVRVPGAGVVVW
jgi:hypothetical protein